MNDEMTRTLAIWHPAADLGLTLPFYTSSLHTCHELAPRPRSWQVGLGTCVAHAPVSQRLSAQEFSLFFSNMPLLKELSREIRSSSNLRERDGVRDRFASERAIPRRTFRSQGRHRGAPWCCSPRPEWTLVLVLSARVRRQGKFSRGNDDAGSSYFFACRSISWPTDHFNCQGKAKAAPTLHRSSAFAFFSDAGWRSRLLLHVSIDIRRIMSGECILVNAHRQF